MSRTRNALIVTGEVPFPTNMSFKVLSNHFKHIMVYVLADLEYGDIPGGGVVTLVGKVHGELFLHVCVHLLQLVSNY